MARIMFVHRGVGLGGAPRSLRNIVEAVRPLGHECVIACMQCESVVRFLRESGAEVVTVRELPRYTNSTTNRFRVGSREFRAQQAYARGYADYWKRTLQKHGEFDLVFLNSMVLCDLIAPSTETGAKVIQAVRETAAPGESLVVMREKMHQADAAMFISSYDRDLFDLEIRSEVIPNFSYPENLSCTEQQRASLRGQLGYSPDEVLFLFTGGLSAIKGSLFLLDLLSEISLSPAVRFLVAGYTPSRSTRQMVKGILDLLGLRRDRTESMKRALRRARRNPHVQIDMLGFVRNIDDYYKISDVCLVPYNVPHQARPIFEAGFARMPCLVSDFSCFRDAIEDGENGLLLPLEPEPWARAIQRMVEETGFRLRLGEGNYRHAMKYHNAHVNVPMIRQFFQSMLPG